MTRSVEGSLSAMIPSVDLSLRCELLCYLIDPVGIERNMAPYLHNSRKRILVRPHRIDGLLSSSGNAVVIAITFIRAVGRVIRPFQLGKINVLTWNVLNGRIRCFAERCGYRQPHGPRRIRQRERDCAGWKSDDPGLEASPAFLSLFWFPLSARAQPFRNCVACSTNSSEYWYYAR